MNFARLANPVMLAAGHDRDGARAAELLSIGFGAVEFGTVCLAPVAGRHAGAAALAARLRPLHERANSRVGINLGVSPGSTADDLAREWLTGWQACRGAADYLAFNLSGDDMRPLLAQQHETRLWRALIALALARDELGQTRDERIAIAVKVPLGENGPLPPALGLAARARLDAVIAVLPPGPARFERLRRAAVRLDGHCALIAVGGLRDAVDVAAARAAGAAAVQVHAAFAERGMACLPALLPTPENH